MAKKDQTPAAKAAPAAATAPAEQQGNLPAGSTDTDASAAVAVAPGSTDAAGSTEQTTQAPGADAAPTVVEPTASTTGQDAQLIQGDDAAAAAASSQPAAAAFEGLVVGASGIAPEPYPPEVDVGVDPLKKALAELTGLKLAAGMPAAPADVGGHSDEDLEDDDLGDGEIEGLWIRAVPEQGFRRLGMRFTREGHGVALSALTDDQVAALISDPNLTVEHGFFSGLVE